MFHHVREQVIAEFAECSTPSGCVQTRAKPLVIVRPMHRPGVAVLVEVGTAVRRIVRFPAERSGKPSAA